MTIKTQSQASAADCTDNPQLLTDRERDRVPGGDIHIIKKVDVSSPLLMLNCADRAPSKVER
jgi:type VI protein secretion system component Hcp